MAIEGQAHGLVPAGSGQLGDEAQDCLVADVDTVVGPDGHDGTLGAGLGGREVVDDTHAQVSALTSATTTAGLIAAVRRSYTARSSPRPSRIANGPGPRSGRVEAGNVMP